MKYLVLILSWAVVLASVNGISLRDIAGYLLGGGGGGYQEPYPGSYPGQYPGYPSGGGHQGAHRPPGPPGAHPGCPLCDSSVYGYCSHKQAHDSCCCNQGYNQYGCRSTDCRFLYANSCNEHSLITNCCCVDLQRQALVPAATVLV